jgi:predicted nucleic acid-binding protein
VGDDLDPAGRVYRVGDGALDALRVQRLALTADVVVALAELRVSSGLRMPDCCVLLAAHATGGTVATFDHRLADAARAGGFDTTS